MEQNLFDQLYAEFVADRDEDEPTSVSRYIAYCKRKMAERPIQAAQYTPTGQYSLLFADGRSHTLGDPPKSGGLQPGHSISAAFMTQAQNLNRPSTIEVMSIPLTRPMGG